MDDYREDDEGISENEQALNDAYDEGYNDGYADARKEDEDDLADAEDEMEHLRREYDRMSNELEETRELNKELAGGI